VLHLRHREAGSAASRHPDLDLELLASVLDRDTLTGAVHDFRNALAEREA
jgi:hypothetical protein